MDRLIQSPKTLQAIKKYRQEKGEPPNIPFMRQWYLRAELINIATNPIYCNGCDSALLIEIADLCQEMSLGAIKISVQTLDAVMPRPEGYEIVEGLIGFFVEIK